MQRSMRLIVFCVMMFQLVVMRESAAIGAERATAPLAAADSSRRPARALNAPGARRYPVPAGMRVGWRAPMMGLLGTMILAGAGSVQLHPTTADGAACEVRWQAGPRSSLMIPKTVVVEGDQQVRRGRALVALPAFGQYLVVPANGFGLQLVPTRQAVVPEPRVPEVDGTNRFPTSLGCKLRPERTLFGQIDNAFRHRRR